MKIAVIILHYGDREITKTCIASLQRHETFPYELIVVNNMPEVMSPAMFSKKKIIVINNKKNLGFSGGVNIGIQYALRKKYDAVLLLNNDTTIVKPFLSELADNLYGCIGIAAPAIRFKKDNHVLYDLGGKVNMWTSQTSHREVQKIASKKPVDVMYVSGCCMLITKDVFKKNGLFDERFFLYYEDVDFCLRARQKGFGIIVAPSVTINHALSASAGKMSNIAIYHLTKSLILFGKKYFNSGIKKYVHRVFVLYQSFVFLVKSRYGIYAWKAILEA